MNDGRWGAGALNVRDLGGVRVEGGLLRPLRLIRGESPSVLPAGVVDELVARGVRTFVDLRAVDEAAQEGVGSLEGFVRSGRVVVASAPLMPSARWLASERGGRPYEFLDEAYVESLRNGLPGFVSALRSADPDGGVYVHCAAGKDRTGVAVAVLLEALGAGRDVVVADFLRSGERFEALAARLGASSRYPEFASLDWSLLVPRRDVIVSALNRVAADGGARSWLMRAGFDDASWAVFRASLLCRCAV